MQIYASKEELADLPDWVGDFLTAAWAPPDDDGQRAPLGLFEGLREIGDRFAKRLQAEMRRPEIYRHDISFVVNEKSVFVEYASIADRQVHIAHELMQVWNRRATLANCESCGNLMQPAKGRIARTCSDACRLKVHRAGNSRLGQALATWSHLASKPGGEVLSRTAAPSAASRPRSPKNT